jgi:hypothetical protein
MEKPPSKTMQAAKERADRRAERIALRERKAAAVELAANLARRVPPEFQSWGAVRTRAWKRAAMACLRITKNPKRSPMGSVEDAITEIRRACTAPLDTLQPLPNHD